MHVAQENLVKAWHKNFRAVYDKKKLDEKTFATEVRACGASHISNETVSAWIAGTDCPRSEQEHDALLKALGAGKYIETVKNPGAFHEAIYGDEGAVQETQAPLTAKIEALKNITRLWICYKAIEKDGFEGFPDRVNHVLNDGWRSKLRVSRAPVLGLDLNEIRIMQGEEEPDVPASNIPVVDLGYYQSGPSSGDPVADAETRLHLLQVDTERVSVPRRRVTVRAEEPIQLQAETIKVVGAINYINSRYVTALNTQNPFVQEQYTNTLPRSFFIVRLNQFLEKDDIYEGLSESEATEAKKWSRKIIPIISKGEYLYTLRLANGLSLEDLKKAIWTVSSLSDGRHVNEKDLQRFESSVRTADNPTLLSRIKAALQSLKTADKANGFDQDKFSALPYAANLVQRHAAADSVDARAFSNTR